MAKKVTVEGEVVIRTENKGTLIDLYSEDFILPNEVKNEAQARSVIKNGLLAERLRKSVKNYKSFRTYEITAFDKSDEKVEKDGMESMLVEANNLNCIPTNLVSYSTTEGKKKALKKAIDVAKRRNAKPSKDIVKDEGYID